MDAIGISIGILIGVVTAIVTLLILRDAFPAQRARRSWVEKIFGRRQASGLRLAARVAMLPIFWFGGPWATGALLQSIDWTELLSTYLISLVITYLLIIAIPLVRLIIKVASMMR